MRADCRRRDDDAPRPGGGPPGAGPPGLSRRALLRRVAAGAGALAAAGVALAVSEGDRGADAARPLFTDTMGAADPTVVLLPGLGATTRFWGPRVAPLAARARLVLVDLLGFGRSPKPWTTYTVDRHVAALHGVLGPLAEARGPLTLVGHSLGARLAATYAARYPGAVRRLVLVSLPYFGGAERAKGYFRRRGAEGWVMTHMLPAAVVCLLSRRLLGWALPSLLPDLPREVAEDLTQMTWRSSTSTLWEAIYEYDLGPDLERVAGRVPMLCLHGDRDERAPLGPVLALARAHPGCEVRVRAGAGHLLPLADPAWVRAAVASVLPRAERPGAEGAEHRPDTHRTTRREHPPERSLEA